MSKKALLMILDGWGIGDSQKDDVISQTPTPYWDYLMANYRDKTVLVASHGLFLQFLMARIANVPIENTREVEHMRNCETRWFDI